MTAPATNLDTGLLVNQSEPPADAENKKKQDKKSLAVALCTVIFSIPALIVGVAITTGARHAAHTISLIIDAVIILALCLYVTYKGRQRDPYPYSFFQKWGPTILCWISFPLIIADPLRHVLNDQGAWDGCNRKCRQLWPSHCHWSSNEYKCALRCGELDDYACDDQPRTYIECTCVHDSQESLTHLSMIGWLFTIFFTYFGFTLFMIGNLWNASIIEKCKDIRHKYRVLRGHSVDEEY